MCGIVSYSGRSNALEVILKGLQKLEYRGYDSVGISLISGSEIITNKHVGSVSEFSSQISENSLQNFKSSCGIGHTRWATHGKVDLTNTHPHFSNNKKIAVVHNGIIENYLELKTHLEKLGFSFYSETDTEVIPNLVQSFVDTGMNLIEAFKETLKMLKGSFAIAMVTSIEPKKIFIAKCKSPLVIGKNKGEFYVASDANALLEFCNNFLFMEDETYAILEYGKQPKLFNFRGNSVKVNFKKLKLTAKQVSNKNYDDYMLKEINEQPEVIKNIISEYLSDSGFKSEFLNLNKKDFKRIIILACGSSYNAGLLGKYWIEKFAQIPTNVEIASEFKLRNPVLKKSDLIIAISQSGETADTISAVEYAKSKKCKIVAICNTPESTLDRMSNQTIFLNAGHEVGVAATKTFLAQVAILFLIAINLAHNKFKKFKIEEYLSEFTKISDKIHETLSFTSQIESLSQKYAHFKNFFFLGRGLAYPLAIEGALKLKEISYIHAEGLPVGEMKHGSIALIDELFPSVVLAFKNFYFDKTLSNALEIKARNGKVILFTDEQISFDSKFIDDFLTLPQVKFDMEPFVFIVILQLFAYYVAKKLGRNVDKPRNLAKSVTVE
ncbi:MAG: glutamine--fructose-6-phosphate aminotransferase [isomerizing] [Candidatus Dojkabacteria bacterium]|nr:MAG: glutamine--fructose-6-phosphate aminotransferase [isomerizing] [Candidatus Dojkabacteria bacterium]